MHWPASAACRLAEARHKGKPMNDIEQMPAWTDRLSVRTRKALSELIQWPHKLLHEADEMAVARMVSGMTTRELLGTWTIGLTTYCEIRDWLGRLGFPEPDDPDGRYHDAMVGRGVNAKENRRKRGARIISLVATIKGLLDDDHTDKAMIKNMLDEVVHEVERAETRSRRCIDAEAQTSNNNMLNVQRKLPAS
jgi:hypothetical protein